jgi:hypothetical protein
VQGRRWGIPVASGGFEALLWTTVFVGDTHAEQPPEQALFSYSSDISSFSESGHML